MNEFAQRYPNGIESRFGWYPFGGNYREEMARMTCREDEDTAPGAWADDMYNDES